MKLEFKVKNVLTMLFRNIFPKCGFYNGTKFTCSTTRKLRDQS